MADHPAIRLRADNILFVRFGGRAVVPAAGTGSSGRTCRSCAHWCVEDAAYGGGRCLADCGVRTTAPGGTCGRWRRLPLGTVV